MAWLWVPEESEILPRLARIEDKIDRLMRAEHRMETSIMALKATDQALITEVHRNTDVAAAANKAMTAQTTSITDLTKKLTEAIANSDASDDSDVVSALNELRASNDAQVAATPALAAAVANTDPNAPVPVVQ